MKISLSGVLMAIVFAFSNLYSTSAQTPAFGLPGEIVPGELIVMFHNNIDDDFVAEFERENLIVNGYYCNLKMERVLSPLSYIYLFTFNENHPDQDFLVKNISGM